MLPPTNCMAGAGHAGIIMRPPAPDWVCGR
jgi:hypothetical protein